MVAILAGLTWFLGPIQVLKLYFVPYWIFVMWLDFVTYLHHHGHEEKIPWYRGKEWSYIRGGLTTLDRDYGWINNIHHDIGTRVIHHLFPQMPHYRLVEAVSTSNFTKIDSTSFSVVCIKIYLVLLECTQICFCHAESKLWPKIAVILLGKKLQRK